MPITTERVELFVKAKWEGDDYAEQVLAKIELPEQLRKSLLHVISRSFADGYVKGNDASKQS